MRKQFILLYNNISTICIFSLHYTYRGYVVDYFYFFSYISPDKFIVEPRGVNEQLVISRVSKDVTVRGINAIFILTTIAFTDDTFISCSSTVPIDGIASDSSNMRNYWNH